MILSTTPDRRILKRSLDLLRGKFFEVFNECSKECLVSAMVQIYHSPCHKTPLSILTKFGSEIYFKVPFNTFLTVSF